MKLPPAPSMNRAERRLLVPPFHGARMRAHGEQICETALRHAAELPMDRPFIMQDFTHAMTLEIMIRANGIDTQ